MREIAEVVGLRETATAQDQDFILFSIVPDGIRDRSAIFNAQGSEAGAVSSGAEGGLKRQRDAPGQFGLSVLPGPGARRRY